MHMKRRIFPALLLVAGVGACSGGGGSSKATSKDSRSTPAAEPVVALAAGDIAGCGSDGDEATARLLDTRPGTVLALGDVAYDQGSPAQFDSCFGPSWGRFRDRIKPVPGNHEYGTAGAQGYYGYFGLEPPGWYSFDLGQWHVVALNSNCGAVGGCGPDSEQVRWFRADLAAAGARCTLAYWHHPRYSSGVTHGDNAEVDGLWVAAVEGGVDVVLNGHEHNYERFDVRDGVRQFVVGTGGRSHYPLAKTPRPGSKVRSGNTFGVLELTLLDGSYRWRFVPVEGESFTDAGRGACR
jgi:3',5'-cyclic AMP phosphodiesterase CpdA